MNDNSTFQGIVQIFRTNVILKYWVSVVLEQRKLPKRVSGVIEVSDKLEDIRYIIIMLKPVADPEQGTRGTCPPLSDQLE